MWFFASTNHLTLGSVDPLGLVPCRIPLRERAKHTYVAGITGQGKSKLLEHLVFQDVVHGRGCGVIDPHSDLVDDLLHYLSSHPRRAEPHWTRILYVDPARGDYLVPYNVLCSRFSPYETATNVVEAFRRTWPTALAEAPRFANLCLAALLTLIANDLTLVEMPRLLVDKPFRQQLLARVDDPELVSFWQDRYEKWGRETPLMTESVLNKVTAFTLNPQLRRMLGAPENGLDLGAIMDGGKVLLVDLGRCDAETRKLIGSLLVTGFEQAARARRDDGVRRPFYLTIDEFHAFCAHDGSARTLAEILSECRKFSLHLTLAHQTLSQLSQRLQGALGNVQLKILFGLARADAEVLARHLFQPDGERIKHTVPDETQQERSHPVYYSLQEEWERHIQLLQNLSPRTALMRRPGRAGVAQIRTIPIHYRAAGEAVESLRSLLARQSGQAVSMLEAAIQRRQTVPKQAQAPVSMRQKVKRGRETAAGSLRRPDSH